jgi:periplasmic copper chaperone A
MFRALFLLLALLAVPAGAHNYMHGEIKIGHAWAPTTTSRTGAAYVPLLNTSKEDADTLTGAETPVAEEVQIHQTKIEKGIAKMRRLMEVKLPPGEKVEFKPRGLHLMLIGLKEPLKDGDRIPLTLHFARAGDIKVDIHIQKTASTNDELHDHH